MTWRYDKFQPGGCPVFFTLMTNKRTNDEIELALHSLLTGENICPGAGHSLPSFGVPGTTVWCLSSFFAEFQNTYITTEQLPLQIYKVSTS